MSLTGFEVLRQSGEGPGPLTGVLGHTPNGSARSRPDRATSVTDGADLVGFAEIGAHGEKSGPELFRDLFEPGPETRVITIGVLRATHAR